MVERLISGGQTGADMSIVEVGRQLDVPIGGLVPKGWQTELGPTPALAALGFTESPSSDYAVRTRRNVEVGDATLIFATDSDSDGTRLTIDHARSLGKRCLVVDPFHPTAVETVKRWLRATNPRVLNVAGNRESKSPGIAGAAERVLLAALSAGAVDQRGP